MSPTAIALFRRVIAQSYPACNTIMLSGCVLSLSSIYLFGLDGQIISPAVFPNICQIKTWVLSIGFTLGYGAMYSKVWRVHRLHTSQKKNAIRVRAVRVVFSPGVPPLPAPLEFAGITGEMSPLKCSVDKISQLVRLRKFRKSYV